MRCTFEQTAESVHRCTRCKRTVKTNVLPIIAECRKPGLGDYVAKGLAALGIKKKSNCGCDKRQTKLNELGEKVGL